MRRNEWSSSPECALKGKAIETEEIPAYCAVALAGLGNLPDTLLSRAVVIRMRRRNASECIEPFRRRVHEKAGHALREKIAFWASSVQGKINAWPQMPAGVTDRDADVWEALLAVADAAGGNWPERARAAAVMLVALAKKSSPSLGIRLLADLRNVFQDADALHTATILTRLCGLAEAPWGDFKGKPLSDRGLSNLLRQYEVESKDVRLGNDVRKGYRREDLHDAWVRYLPAASAERATGATRATDDDLSGLDAQNLSRM
jgi:hypothetical protein